MPRKARFCPAGYPVHVIQRGNNRQAIFTCDADLAAYAHWLAEGAERFGVSIHGWVFMTNHVHLLVTPSRDVSLSQLMQYLGRLYVRHFNAGTVKDPADYRWSSYRAHAFGMVAGMWSPFRKQVHKLRT